MSRLLLLLVVVLARAAASPLREACAEELVGVCAGHERFGLLKCVRQHPDEVSHACAALALELGAPCRASVERLCESATSDVEIRLCLLQHGAQVPDTCLREMKSTTSEPQPALASAPARPRQLREEGATRRPDAAHPAVLRRECTQEARELCRSADQGQSRQDCLASRHSDRSDRCRDWSEALDRAKTFNTACRLDVKLQCGGHASSVDKEAAVACLRGVPLARLTDACAAALAPLRDDDVLHLPAVLKASRVGPRSRTALVACRSEAAELCSGAEEGEEDTVSCLRRREHRPRLGAACERAVSLLELKAVKRERPAREELVQSKADASSRVPVRPFVAVKAECAAELAQECDRKTRSTPTGVVRCLRSSEVLSPRCERALEAFSEHRMTLGEAGKQRPVARQPGARPFAQPVGGAMAGAMARPGAGPGARPADEVAARPIGEVVEARRVDGRSAEPRSLKERIGTLRSACGEELDRGLCSSLEAQEELAMSCLGARASELSQQCRAFVL